MQGMCCHISVRHAGKPRSQAHLLYERSSGTHGTHRAIPIRGHPRSPMIMRGLTNTLRMRFRKTSRRTKPSRASFSQEVVGVYCHVGDVIRNRLQTHGTHHHGLLVFLNEEALVTHHFWPSLRTYIQVCLSAFRYT
jgi:hypothetical protein